MAVITRALTAPTQRRHALSNINYASNGPSLLLRDRRTFLRGAARTLQFCTDWADIAATGGTRLGRALPPLPRARPTPSRGRTSWRTGS